MADEPAIRAARPEDYEPIAAVADQWWGRPVTHVLPRLFLDHFHRTSLPDEAYIHFLGVSPGHRRRGLARTLYGHFLDIARADGHRIVRAVTSPVNTTSIAFRRKLGFAVTHPATPSPTVHDDYVRFSKRLG